MRFDMDTFISNFLSGASTILDLFPEDLEKNNLPMRSDTEQLAEDWKSVGDNLRDAISQEAISQEAVRHGEKE